MRQRSFYPKPFKAQVVQECLKPGDSVSSVAISHGINANVIRKGLPIYRDKPAAPLPAFVPLQPMPKRHAGEAVVIALPLSALLQYQQKRWFLNTATDGQEANACDAAGYSG